VEIELSSKYFNLDFTLCCGQTFRWHKLGDWWYGVVGQEAFKIRQLPETLEFEGADKKFVWNYFRLNDDLPKILSDINKDENVQAAINEFRGLRILRQEPWECLISYICATCKNITAIKSILSNLSRRFGEEIHLDHQSFYGFPKPTRLAKAELQELEACGLGYRAEYVLSTAKSICESTLNLEHLKKKAYDEAKQGLMDFPGVGPKVSDCVLLFSLEKLEAFPIDVWIKRTILEYYAHHLPTEFVKSIFDQGSLSNNAYKRLSSFGREYFGKYAGYAQEYLYHYRRMCH